METPFRGQSKNSPNAALTLVFKFEKTLLTVILNPVLLGEGSAFRYASTSRSLA
jgi:hypothetical protein